MPERATAVEQASSPCAAPASSSQRRPALSPFCRAGVQDAWGGRGSRRAGAGGRARLRAGEGGSRAAKPPWKRPGADARLLFPRSWNALVDARGRGRCLPAAAPPAGDRGSARRGWAAPPRAWPGPCPTGRHPRRPASERTRSPSPVSAIARVRPVGRAREGSERGSGPASSCTP